MNVNEDNPRPQTERFGGYSGEQVFSGREGHGFR